LTRACSRLGFMPGFAKAQGLSPPPASMWSRPAKGGRPRQRHHLARATGRRAGAERLRAFGGSSSRRHPPYRAQCQCPQRRRDCALYQPGVYHGG
jgi:hypothetical protein